MTGTTSPQVIVASDEGSPTVTSLVECVASLGGEAHVVSTRWLSREGCVALDANGAELMVGGRRLRLDACRGIWNWHADPPLAVDDDDATARYVRREWELTLRGLVATSPDSIWVNSPLRASWLEGNKLAQMHLAARAGFVVPPTLLSNDPDKIVGFARQFDQVAVKSQGGAWRELPDGGVAVAYTQRCTSGELDASRGGLSRAPVLVQPYLEKSYELRVTVVDGTVFVCRIDSQTSARTEVDWRRDANAVQHELVNISPAEVDRIRALVDAAGLRYAAIDLACTRDGQTYFLGLNPSGQFGWIEARTGAPILRTLAEALMRPLDSRACRAVLVVGPRSRNGADSARACTPVTLSEW